MVSSSGALPIYHCRSVSSVVLLALNLIWAGVMVELQSCDVYGAFCLSHKNSAHLLQMQLQCHMLLLAIFQVNGAGEAGWSSCVCQHRERDQPVCGATWAWEQPWGYCSLGVPDCVLTMCAAHHACPFAMQHISGEAQPVKLGPGQEVPAGEQTTCASQDAVYNCLYHCYCISSMALVPLKGAP